MTSSIRSLDVFEVNDVFQLYVVKSQERILSQFGYNVEYIIIIEEINYCLYLLWYDE